MWFRKLVTFILEALLGLFMVYTTYTLFAWTPEVVTKVRDALNYPQWYWQLAGVLAAISAAALLVGLFNRVIGAFGALWSVAYFIGACASHMVRGDWADLYLPLTFLVLAAILVWLRWGDAKPMRARLGMA